MAAGVTIEDPATTYIDADVHGRRRHDHPSRRVARRAHDDRRRLRDPQRRAHRRLADRRSRDDPQPLRDHRLARSRDDASVGPFAHLRSDADVARRRKVGNFVELKKTVLGAGLEGDAPGLSRRRDDRREGQHRRRHDHLQLRRREQAPDDHRGRRVHRQRLAARSRRSRSARAPTSAAASTIREDVPPGALAVSAGQAAQHRGLGRRRSAKRRRKKSEGQGLKPCAGSSDTSARRKSFRSSSTGCGGSNTAATTRRASPSCATARSTCGAAPASCRTSSR